jgi:hypothetical protein
MDSFIFYPASHRPVVPAFSLNQEAFFLLLAKTELLAGQTGPLAGQTGHTAPGQKSWSV